MKKVITNYASAISTSYPHKKSLISPYIEAFIGVFPAVHSTNNSNRFI